MDRVEAQLQGSEWGSVYSVRRTARLEAGVYLLSPLTCHQSGQSSLGMNHVLTFDWEPQFFLESLSY